GLNTSSTSGGAGCSSRWHFSSPFSSPRCSASETRSLRDSLPERKIECRQQRPRLIVIARGGADGDIHAPDVCSLVVIDFREHDVLLDAERVVAAAVKTLRRQTAEVSNPRQRDIDETVEKLVHARFAQGHLA